MSTHIYCVRIRAELAFHKDKSRRVPVPQGMPNQIARHTCVYNVDGDEDERPHEVKTRERIQYRREDGDGHTRVVRWLPGKSIAR